MRRPVSVALFASVVAVSCSHGSSSPTVDGIGWAPGASETANGTAPQVDLLSACGSTTATYLAELVNGSPLDAQVLREWGDCVAGGKDVMVSGRVAATHLGPTDLPMDHPFADDLSMDVVLDPPCEAFAQTLGTVSVAVGEGGEAGGEEEEEAGPADQTTMHVEISSGFIPHLPSTATPPPNETVRQAADANLAAASFQPGFTGPQPGDRVIVMGRWIIDCGHPNFAAELHTMSFLAWTHTETNGTTTARFFYNPYRDTELYASMTPAQLGAVDDTTRYASAQPFPHYFIQEILGLDSGTTDRLRSLELIEATHVSPVDWEISLPEGSGSNLTLHYDVVARPGTAVSFTQDASRGCVAMHRNLGSYVAAPQGYRSRRRELRRASRLTSTARHDARGPPRRGRSARSSSPPASPRLSWQRFTARTNASLGARGSPAPSSFAIARPRIRRAARASFFSTSL